MMSETGCPRLCPECPLRAKEGTDEYNPLTGDLVGREGRYITSDFEYVDSQTPGVSSQETGVRFVDKDGNATDLLAPGVQLEDIANRKSEDEVAREGIRGWWKRRQRNREQSQEQPRKCGAETVRLAILRQRMDRFNKRRRR